MFLLRLVEGQAGPIGFQWSCDHSVKQDLLDQFSVACSRYSRTGFIIWTGSGCIWIINKWMLSHWGFLCDRRFIAPKNYNVSSSKLFLSVCLFSLFLNVYCMDPQGQGSTFALSHGSLFKFSVKPGLCSGTHSNAGCGVSFVLITVSWLVPSCFMWRIGFWLISLRVIIWRLTQHVT